MNALLFHRNKNLISISLNPFAYRVAHVPTRREWDDQSWSSRQFLIGSRLYSWAAAARIAV